MIKLFAGVDVQIKRGCCYYIIDENKKFVESGWIKENIPNSFKELFLKISNKKPEQIMVGIDSPRMPIDKPRKRNFDRKSNPWNQNDEPKLGREYEVIIKSYNIANPQWTRTMDKSPDWMNLGFSIYNALKSFPFVYEIFPSTSYKMLKKENVKYELVSP